MTISENKIYPRTGDNQTVYLKNVITNESIKIGDYTMYNDFAHDPREFEKNNVLYTDCSCRQWRHVWKVE